MERPLNNSGGSPARLLRETGKLLLAPLVVGIMALALYVLGSIPAQVQAPPGTGEYNSIQEAQSAFGAEIAVPAYFPSYLAWPPEQILVQVEPPPATARLAFFSRESHVPVFLTYQALADDRTTPAPLPWVDKVMQEIDADINGHAGHLVIGEREDGRLVNGVYWKTDDFSFAVVTTQSVRELLTLARSMH